MEVTKLKALAVLGIVVLVMLTECSTYAKSGEVDFGQIAHQLSQYARDLRNAEEEMRLHAGSTMPKGLDAKLRKRFEARRRELNATADAARNLASQIEIREKMARLGTLTRTDLESLQSDVDPLSQRIKQRLTRAEKQESMGSAKLNTAINEVEVRQETARNERQTAKASFENFDQKSSQLYVLLSSVMKAFNEMRMGTMRNML
jgi:Skp family chaperone for outer membrane proteins